MVRGTKSGWAFAARVKGVIIAEGSDATELTLSSMQTEINAITLHFREPSISYVQTHHRCFLFSVHFGENQRKASARRLDAAHKRQPDP